MYRLDYAGSLLQSSIVCNDTFMYIHACPVCRPALARQPRMRTCRWMRPGTRICPR